MPTEEEQVLELQSKQLVGRFKDELWNKTNLDIIDELCHPQFEGEITGVPFPGVVRSCEELKQVIATYHAAFDVDASRRPVFMITEDQDEAVMVVDYRYHRLRHKGEFQGIPPTGKEVIVAIINIYAIVGRPVDKIIYQVFQFDMRSLRQQLRGAIPTPG